MNPSARRLDHILNDSPLAAAILARLAAARRAALVIAPVCAELAPDFDPTRPGACDVRAGVLRIWLRSSAHSTKLRQAIPRMAALLDSQGLQISEIKVGVQLRRVREKPLADPGVKDREGRHLSASPLRKKSDYLSPLAFADKLALTLKDSDLRRAVVRLQQSLQTRLAGIRDSNQPFYQQHREKKDTRG